MNNISEQVRKFSHILILPDSSASLVFLYFLHFDKIYSWSWAIIIIIIITIIIIGRKISYLMRT
jgi:hypothetical protein